MQLERLLTDVTKGVVSAAASTRARYAALAALLNGAHGAGSITAKGVAKWFERKSVPGPWLMKIAALPKKPINLADYS